MLSPDLKGPRSQSAAQFNSQNRQMLGPDYSFMLNTPAKYASAEKTISAHLATPDAEKTISLSV
jgi:hypothetical protein